MQTDARAISLFSNKRTRIVLIAIFAWLLLGVLSTTSWVADAESAGEQNASPSVCTAYTPRVSIAIDQENSPWILPGGPRRVNFQVTVPQCGSVANPDPPTNGTVTVSLPWYMTIVSATPNPVHGGTITVGDQTITYNHGRMSDSSGGIPIPYGNLQFSARFQMPQINNVPDAPANGWVGIHSTYAYSSGDNGSTTGSRQMPLGYSLLRATTTRTEPAGIGDEIPYTLHTNGYPYFQMVSSMVVITAPPHTQFVAGSHPGTLQGNSVVVDLGTNSSPRAINFKLRVLPSLTPTTRHFIPTYRHDIKLVDPNVVMPPGVPPTQWTLPTFLASNQYAYARPSVEMKWLTQGTAMPLDGELPIKVQIKNPSTTSSLTEAQLSSTVTYAGEGLAQLVTPLPSNVSLGPGETKEIEYRLKGTRAGKFKITGEAQARSGSTTFLSIPVTSPELCVGCADAELEIVLDKTRYEIGETFVAYARAKSNRHEPMTIAFNDPLMDQEAPEGSPPEPMLAIEEVAAPAPFTLTPEQPTRSFPVVAKVDRFGVAKLVSSFAYTLPGREPETVETKRAVSASPLKVEIQITPKQNVLDLTDPEKKTETCRQLELLPLVNNCIEIVTKVTNTSDQTVTNVHIPNAQNPLGMINEVDPKVPGEPLLEIQRQIPDGQITLGPGEEATWTWRMEAFDAPASLEFEPTVFGVMGGVEIGAHATKEFEILESVLLKWGMRPTTGTTFVSGTNVRTDGYLENVTAEDGGEGKNLRVMVHSSTLRNAGGGFVEPMTNSGRPAEKYHVFNLPPKGEAKRISIKSLFNSFRTEKASSAEIRFKIRLWVVEDDGSLTPAHEQALLDDDYVDEFSVYYHPNSLVTDDGYRTECLKTYRPLICAMVDNAYNDGIPGIINAYKFGMQGLLFLSERNARISMIEATAHQLTIATILEDEAAKNRLMTELHQDYIELHEQQVLFNQVAGQVPMALEEFSMQAVDSLGRFIQAVELGDMKEIETRVGEFLGSNPDLALEPFIIMRTYLKLNRALGEMAEGTADNVYAAAERAAKRRQDGDVEQRVAAAKAQPGDPDLAKALLPGDVLTAKLLIEVFGVDQDTVRRIQKIANEAGVVMAFRARSARASELLRMNLAWPKPQALKQKCVNKLDIDYLGYRPDAYGKIEIMEPPSGIRGKEGQELQDALDEHMELLVNGRLELQGEKGKALRAEVRGRLETRAQEWTKYNPKLELYNPDFSYVRADVNFEASFQWARDMVGDIGPKESRKIYRNDVGRRVDPATGEELRTWEIKMDGPNGQEARHVTGDIDFLGIFDLNGNFINDDNQRIAVYVAMIEAQLMEHGESMSARLQKAREEYLECCIFGIGEGMLTVGPWGAPRVGFFIDNRSVMQQKNAAFKQVRRTEIDRGPGGEVIRENGRPKEVVLRMEDPSGEFPLINGMPTLRHVDEALVRRFRPTLWETVWEHYFERKLKLFFPNYLVDVIENEQQNVKSFNSGTASTFVKGGPIVRLEPVSIIELRQSNRFEIWTIENGWTSATREQVVEAGTPGVIDFAPYSVLREAPAAGSDTLTIAPLSEMGAKGDFFQPGDWIVLNPGEANQETAQIVSMDPLTLTAPLQQEHQVGEMVAWIQQPAAMATVAGFVRTPQGRGIANVDVVITDNAGVSRMARTNTFGRFKFADVQTGQAYILEAKSRRYQFASQKLSVGGDLTDIEIVPLN